MGLSSHKTPLRDLRVWTTPTTHWTTPLPLPLLWAHLGEDAGHCVLGEPTRNGPKFKDLRISKFKSSAGKSGSGYVAMFCVDVSVVSLYVRLFVPCLHSIYRKGCCGGLRFAHCNRCLFQMLAFKRKHLLPPHCSSQRLCKTMLGFVDSRNKSRLCVVFSRVDMGKERSGGGGGGF